jgi:hypothetical protein
MAEVVLDSAIPLYLPEPALPVASDLLAIK